MRSIFSAAGCDKLPARALAVAGGGGGESDGQDSQGGNANAGAGATGGQNGGNNNQEDGGGGGGGAQATIGGTPGAKGYGGAFSECNDGNNGRWGEFLTGGDGANAPAGEQGSGGSSVPVSNGCSLASFPGGGGGGGGYRYGGGGGSPFGRGFNLWETHNAGGGGGGSSYLDPSATKLSLSAGASGDNPLVVPVWNTGVSITSTPNPSVGGTAVTITASVVAFPSYQPVPGGTAGRHLRRRDAHEGPGGGGRRGEPDDHHDPGRGDHPARRLQRHDNVHRRLPYRLQFRRHLLPDGDAVRGDSLFFYPARNLTAISGTDVLFVVALAYPPGGGANPTVQWRTSADGGTTWVNLAGDVYYSSLITDTGSVLRVDSNFTASVSPGDLKYRAIATSCSGSTTSNAGTLTVRGIAFSLASLPAKTFGNAPFDVAGYATGSSVAVGFTSVTPAVCTVAEGAR